MDALLFLNGETLTGDVVLDGAGLAVDRGLETAIAVSLFTDRRADPDDVLPDPNGQRRGWWGDVVPPTVDGTPADGDRIGSRLWLLSREKIIPETIARARTYAREALQWLIDDGVAARIDVDVTVPKTPVGGGVLALAITVYRPDGGAENYDYAWTGQAQKGSA
ncbi:MAG: phage GP46 family protein [Alphaproteobacteria bacterium]|nr:phage GP46 family protein [Alphaproteobacteria bacterium]MBF0249972.1 phage GP46 family protein [Alphaproteobacteria bacterium]